MSSVPLNSILPLGMLEDVMQIEVNSYFQKSIRKELTWLVILMERQYFGGKLKCAGVIVIAVLTKLW